MFRILLATDGSVYAFKAAEFTAGLCKRMTDVEVTIVYIVDTSLITSSMAAGMGMTVSTTALFPDELEKVGNKTLQMTQERFAAAGTKAQTRMARGRPAEVICSIAEQEKFDMIVVGSSGMGKIAGIFLGSVSDKVVHRARVPVVVVRGVAEA